MPRSEPWFTIDEQKQAFVRRTRRYLDLGYDRHAAAQFVAKLIEQAEGPVLDVGTGKGLLAIALAERFPDVVPIDVSTDDLAPAAALAGEAGVLAHIRFLTLDATCVPFPDDHFGCIAMMDLLHHLEHGEPVLTEATSRQRSATPPTSRTTFRNKEDLACVERSQSPAE